MILIQNVNISKHNIKSIQKRNENILYLFFHERLTTKNCHKNFWTKDCTINKKSKVVTRNFYYKSDFYCINFQTYRKYVYDKQQRKKWIIFLKIKTIYYVWSTIVSCNPFDTRRYFFLRSTIFDLLIFNQSNMNHCLQI